MIDITKEHLLPIQKVPAYLESRGLGKRPHPSVVYRWISKGTGGIRLVLRDVLNDTGQVVDTLRIDLAEPGPALDSDGILAPSRRRCSETALTTGF